MTPNKVRFDIAVPHPKTGLYVKEFRSDEVLILLRDHVVTIKAEGVSISVPLTKVQYYVFEEKVPAWRTDGKAGKEDSGGSPEKSVKKDPPKRRRSPVRKSKGLRKKQGEDEGGVLQPPGGEEL